MHIEHAIDAVLDHLHGLDTDNRLAVIERILSPFHLKLAATAEVESDTPDVETEFERLQASKREAKNAKQRERRKTRGKSAPALKWKDHDGAWRVPTGDGTEYAISKGFRVEVFGGTGKRRKVRRKSFTVYERRLVTSLLLMGGWSVRRGLSPKPKRSPWLITPSGRPGSDRHHIDAVKSRRA
jgi:hypothetical protein